MNKKNINVPSFLEKASLILLPFIMRAFILIICISASSMYANYSFSQTKIDLNLKNVSINSLFEEIQKKSEYIFFYTNDILKTQKKFNLKKEGATIEQILDEAFNGTALSYKVLDRQVVVTKEDINISQNKLVDYQQIIKGKVTDKSGITLPGVTVLLDGTSKGVVTDFDGEFEIKANIGQTLVLSYIGMVTKKVVIDKPNLSLVMEEKIEGLGSIVITGYTNIDKKVFTGASQTIQGKDMVIEGLIDPARMLEGRAAGVNVQNVTGTFGSAPRISIRGGSSIFGDVTPLWVVDGAVQEQIVNLTFDQLVSGDSATLISSAIAGINANDIASIEILKDASALALYGARALNGAVVITTKAGKRDAPSTVSYQAEYTIREVPKYSDYNILNSQQTMGVYREMFDKGFLRLAGSTQGRYGGVYNIMYRAINTFNPDTGQFLLENTPEARNAFLQDYELANTDWFKTLFRATPQQNHTLSFSGGGANSSQYASLGYYTDPGWTIADRTRRITANLRNTYYLSDKLKVGVLIQSSIRDQKSPGTFSRSGSSVFGEFSRDFDINPFSYALNTSRALRPYDNNGNLEYSRYNWAPFNILNELQNNTNDLKVYDIKVQGDMNLKLNDNLEYSFLGSVRYVVSNNEHNITENSNIAAAYNANETTVVANQNIFLFTDPNDPSRQPQIVLPEGGIYNQRSNILSSYYFRNALDFTKNFGDRNTLKLYLGQEYRHSDRVNTFFTGYGYQYEKGGIPFTDYRIIQRSLLADVDYFGKQEDRERGVAFFMQGNLSIKDKYVISATGNYEGSNRLGRSNTARWLPTWNISGKWNVSNEEFLKLNNTISKLSIRFGYGLIAGLGNASNALAIFRNDIANRFDPADRENAINISQLENSELTWEKVYETNIGLDIGLFSNKINMTVDGYMKKSFDLIDFVNTSGIGGQSVKLANNADMETKGIEVSILGKVVNTDNFKWNTTLNFAVFDQKITKLQDRANAFNLVSNVGGNVVGYQRNTLFSYDFAGLNEQGLPTYNFNGLRDPLTGINFQDRTDVLNYLKYEGPVEPNITGGFSNNITYKNWEFSAFITWQAGNKVRLTPTYSSTYSDLDVFPGEFKNRWLVPGDENITSVPVIPDARLNQQNNFTIRRAYNAYNYSTERIVDGSFVRMKNIALAYKFPKDLLEKLEMSQFLLRLQVTNPFLIYSDPNLRGQDPEFFRSGGVALPIQRQYTLTLSFGI